MPSRSNSSKHTSRAILVIVGILVLSALGYFATKYFSKLEETQEKDDTIENLKEEIVDLEEQITEFELTANDQEMEIIENQRQLKETQRKYEEVLNKLNRYQRTEKANLATILDLKGRLDNSQQLITKYEAYLAEKEAQIQALKEDVDSLQESEGLLKNQNEDLIVRNEATRQTLEETRALASILQSKDLQFANIRKKGQKKVDTSFRRGSMHELEVCVTVVENLIATAGERNLYLILESPAGQLTNYKLGLSGKFQAEGQSLEYSAVAAFNFRRLEQQVCVKFLPEPEYKWEKGTYFVRLYAGQDALTQGTFEINTVL
jgi:DNA repair exonuclease SbcCD ATPase subunit